jgi:hypothetical protein
MTVMDPPSFTSDDSVSATSPISTNPDDRIIREMVSDAKTRETIRDLRRKRRHQIDPVQWLARKLGFSR